MPVKSKQINKNVFGLILIASDPLIINTEVNRILAGKPYKIIDLSKADWDQFFQAVCEDDMFNPVEAIVFNNLYRWSIKEYKSNFEKLASDGFAGKTCIFTQDTSDFDYAKLKKLKENIVVTTLGKFKIKIDDLDKKVEGPALARWLQGYAKDRFGLDLTVLVATFIIEKSNYKPTYAASELEKLKTYMGAESTVTQQVLDSALKPSPVNDEMIFFEALSSKNKDIVTIVRQLFDIGLDPIGVLWKLESIISLAIWCKMKNQNPTSWGVKPPGTDWVTKDTQEAALLFIRRSLEWLTASYELLVTLDADLKNTVAVGRDTKSGNQDLFLLRISEMCKIKG